MTAHLTPEQVIALIDAAVGPPESESELDHEKRVRMVERAAERRRIRKAE